MNLLSLIILIQAKLVFSQLEIKKVNHNKDLFDTFKPIYNSDTSINDEASNLLNTLSLKDKLECAQKCALMDSKCKMISFKQSSCKLFKTVKYSLSVSTTSPILYEKIDIDYSSINNYLTHYWPLNGNLNDIIGGSHYYNLVSGSFVNDRLNSPLSALNINYGTAQAPSDIYFDGDFTVSLWVKLTQAQTKPLISFGTNRDDDFFFGVENSGSVSRINYFVKNGATLLGYSIYGPYTLKAGVWTHFAFTLTNSIATSYVNGEIYNQAAQTGSLRKIVRTVNYLGCSNWNICNVYAIYDDIKIFNKSLTQQEIHYVLNSYY